MKKQITPHKTTIIAVMVTVSPADLNYKSGVIYIKFLLT